MTKKFRRTIAFGAIFVGANAGLSLFNTAQAAEVRQRGYCGQVCNCDQDFNCNFNGANCYCNVAFNCSLASGCYDGRQS